VVLGFDGADARTVARMMAEGRLPNLKALAEAGTFAPLRSTNPAESAAGWAAINTGANPLKNGVPGFLKRSGDGKPKVVAAHLESGPGLVADLGPTGWLGLYTRHGTWLIAAAAGVGTLLVTLLLARFLLRGRTRVALGAGLVLGTAAGWGASLPARYTFASVPSVYRTKVSQPGFWDIAAAAGKRALVLDAALAFGRPETPGARVLAGLGLPDATGAMNGAWTIYTTDEEQVSRPPVGTPTLSRSGTVYRVDERDGRVRTKLYGPLNFTALAPVIEELMQVQSSLESAGQGASAQLKARQRTLEEERAAFMADRGGSRASLDLTLERAGGGLAITIDGTTHHAGQGEWTDWFPLAFRLNPLLTIHGITRARVVSLAEPLTVFLDAIHIDPEAPPFWQPPSSPPEFSGQLARWAGGTFETIGWSCMTNQIKDRALPIELFLEDIEFTLRWRERLAMTCLERDDWELLFAVFSTPDRVQHLLYKYYDEGHPRHDPAEAARVVQFFGKPTRLKDVIPAIYEQIDRIVGQVVARLAPEDHLFLCADHGFSSFRYGFQINHWLAQEGYLVYRPRAAKRGRVGLAAAVDWSRTRAYSLGLGMVYVNMRGREPRGVVPKRQAKALLAEISAKLLELTDAGPTDAPFESPRRVVLDTEIMVDTYRGGELAWGQADWPCADLMLGLAENYRVSWDSVHGELRFVPGPNGSLRLGPLIRPNNSNWSGDHASNSPDLVTGLFLSRHPLEVPVGGVSVLHIAPTVLAALGVAPPKVMDKAPLRVR
jgi:predicted AlkP superfamily phosphohydrolase/phosphomutase